MKMLVVALVWAGILSLPVAVGAQPEPEFEDPSAKGSLIPFDHPVIPFEFLGVWADRIENCYVSADRGVQVSISARAIGKDRVAAVEGYSDHPALVATLQKRRGARRVVTLDISRGGGNIRISEPLRERTDLLLRCPPPPDGYEPPNPDEKEIAVEAGRACRTGDFVRLFAAITRSRFVQRRYFGEEIIVSSLSGNRPVSRREFGYLPLRHDDYGYRLATASDWYTQVEVEFLEAGNESMEVRWFERYPTRRDAQAAPRDRLMFRRGGSCWELSGYLTSASEPTGQPIAGPDQ
jgi:hypothetical protein